MPGDQRRFWKTRDDRAEEGDGGSSADSDRSSSNASQRSSNPRDMTALAASTNKQHGSTSTSAHSGNSRLTAITLEDDDGISITPSPSPASNHSALASATGTAAQTSAAALVSHSCPDMDPTSAYDPHDDPLVQIDPTCFSLSPSSFLSHTTPPGSIVLVKHNPDGLPHRFQRPTEAPLHLWPRNAAKLGLKRWMPPAHYVCDRWNTAMYYKTDEESKGGARDRLGYGVEGSDERAVWHAFMYTREDLVCDIVERQKLPTIIVDWLSPDIDTLQYPNMRVAGPITSFSCLYCMAQQRNGSACTVNGKMLYPRGLAHIKLAAAVEKVRTAKSRLRKEAWPKKMNARCWYRSQQPKGDKDTDSREGSSATSSGTSSHPPLSRAPRPLTPPNARLPLTPPQTIYSSGSTNDASHTHASDRSRAHAYTPGTPYSPSDQIDLDTVPRRSPTSHTSMPLRPIAGAPASGRFPLRGLEFTRAPNEEQADITWSGGHCAPQYRRPARIEPGRPANPSSQRRPAPPPSEDDHHVHRVSNRPRYILAPPDAEFVPVESFLVSENRRLRRQRTEAYMQLDDARRHVEEQQAEIARLNWQIDRFSLSYRQPEEGFASRRMGPRLRRQSRSEEPIRGKRDIDELMKEDGMDGQWGRQDEGGMEE